jgi:histidinol-phosphatase (PHP family)
MVGGERRPMASDWASSYIADVDRVRDQFTDIAIFAGIEVGYEMGTDSLIAEFVERHHFDYVLGAVHCLDHVAISSRREADSMRKILVSRGPEWLANRYFDYLHSAIGSGLFDCIAHLDIYRKYLLPVWRNRPEEECFLRVAEERAVPVLAWMAECGVGLELNSAAFRRGDEEPYPSREIAGLARSEGVGVFVTGSDAHCPSDLGRDLDRVTEILAGFGIEPSAFPRRSP